MMHVQGRYTIIYQLTTSKFSDASHHIIFREAVIALLNALKVCGYKLAGWASIRYGTTRSAGSGHTAFDLQYWQETPRRSRRVELRLSQYSSVKLTNLTHRTYHFDGIS